MNLRKMAQWPDRQAEPFGRAAWRQGRQFEVETKDGTLWWAMAKAGPLLRQEMEVGTRAGPLQRSSGKQMAKVESPWRQTPWTATAKAGPRQDEKLENNQTDGASLEDGPFPNQPLFPHHKQHTNESSVFLFRKVF